MKAVEAQNRVRTPTRRASRMLASKDAPGHCRPKKHTINRNLQYGDQLLQQHGLSQ